MAASTDRRLWWSLFVAVCSCAVALANGNCDYATPQGKLRWFHNGTISGRLYFYEARKSGSGLRDLVIRRVGTTLACSHSDTVY